jgi:myo-inositol-1(or 4)-monophosphatase
MIELNNMIREVCDIAKETGIFIRNESGRILRSDVETKSLNSFVTYVDKSAEQLIVKELQALLPQAGFIVEENTIDKHGELYNWVVDPLDGTTNFIHGIPVFSVSIALMHQQEVVLGVVYEINNDECFHAVRTQGAFLNGQPIKVSEAAATRHSLLATGFPYYNYDRLDSFMHLFSWCMANTRGLRRLGSAAVDLAYVACGRFEGFFEYGLNAWDVAAGCLIVQEAGGQVSDFRGGNNYIFGSELVATNKKIHKEFLTQVRSSFHQPDQKA